MSKIIDLIVSGLVVFAKMQDFRPKIVRAGIQLSLIIIATAFCLIGSLLWGWSCFRLIANYWTPELAGLVMGLAAFLISTMIIWSVQRKAR
jgi:hypothetical protein